MRHPVEATSVVQCESSQGHRNRSRSQPVSVASIFAVLVLAAALVGCGGQNTDPAGQMNQIENPSEVTTPRKTNATTGPEQKVNRGDCDLFTEAELGAAFGGKLSFGKFQGYRQRGSGCTAPVIGYEGQFILQAESKESFELRRDTYEGYVEQESASMASVDLGVEAYIINDAQIIAIDDQGRAISVALQLFVFGSELPVTKHESALGVEVIARNALGRL